MRTFLRLPFADTRAPLKVYRGDVADRLFPMLRLDGFGIDTELLFLARKLHLRVLEFPVRWQSGDETTVRIHRMPSARSWSFSRSSGIGSGVATTSMLPPRRDRTRLDERHEGPSHAAD